MLIGGYRKSSLTRAAPRHLGVLNFGLTVRPSASAQFQAIIARYHAKMASRAQENVE